MTVRPFILWILLCGSVFAQNGDKPGEAQTLRVAVDKIPPAPPLSPEEAIRRIHVPSGFEVRLVASEPMIEAPVSAQFDPDGRLYVLEMRGFMPNPDGKGEEIPNGRISILEDTDGDGRMDKSTVFLEGLLLPRAMALCRGGVLVAEPPQLWFCRDTNGDGKCDEKISIASDYGDRKNPEHTANGLVLAMDNWFYNLYHTWRYRWVGGRWTRQPIPNRVQWGLAQDDYGRLFFTSNSDLLRGDFYPSFYAGLRAPNAKLAFLNVELSPDQSVFPARVNPGVNRGYQPKQLRDDGTLATFTAACGTVIYRGDQFPEDCQNDAFVCEPSANLIRHQHVTDRGGVLTSTNALVATEFLTSTDERFRPVNLLNGPDGALYVVDFARGIIQHRIYMTSYLRKQVEDRGLDKPLDQGRIYKVVYKDKPLPKSIRMSKASPADWVKDLAHPNGWIRDTAQRLLVEKSDPSVVPALEKMVTSASDARARVHALWTLEGMGRLSEVLSLQALKDKDVKVKLAAMRCAETFLTAASSSAPSAVLTATMNALRNGNGEVKVQAALSLGLRRQDTNVLALLREVNQSTGSEYVKSATALGLGLLDPQPTASVATQLAGMTPAEQKIFLAGKDMYLAACAACHQPHGLGQEGLAPPLSGSEWVAGPPERLVRIVLHGLRGPLRVKGQNFALEMPTLGVLEDEQIAQILSYVRREWGHSFPMVDKATVAKIREQNAKREDAWTEVELLRIQ